MTDNDNVLAVLWRRTGNIRLQAEAQRFRWDADRPADAAAAEALVPTGDFPVDKGYQPAWAIYRLQMLIGGTAQVVSPAPRRSDEPPTKEHYARPQAPQPPAPPTVATPPAGHSGPHQWSDEDERKHPRGKGDKGGQFVPKGQAGMGNDTERGDAETRRPVSPPRVPASPLDSSPRPRVSIGGRAFEILKKGADWFFRLPKGPWSKASPKAAAAIVGQADPQAVHVRKLRARHKQLAWGDLPVARRAFHRAQGHVARLVGQILESMHKQGDQATPQQRSFEQHWQRQMLKNYLDVMRRTGQVYRQARQEHRDVGQQLRRTPKYLQEITDPDTGETVPRHVLELKQRQAREVARQKLAEDRLKWKQQRTKDRQRAEKKRKEQQEKDFVRRENAKAQRQLDAGARVAVRQERRKLREEGTPLSDEQERQIAYMGPQAQLSAIADIRRQRKEAADAAAREQSARLAEVARKRDEEQRQADEQKRQEAEQRKQQEAEGHQAVEGMAREFGIEPDAVRKAAEQIRPVFGTSTGANLTLPDWHDPRVLARTREVLSKPQQQPEENETSRRLAKEEAREKELAAKRRAPSVSGHGAEYPQRVWDAAQQRLDAGESLEVSDGREVWTIGPKDRDNIRQADDGNLLVARRGRWFELGDQGLEVLGRSAGAPPPREAGEDEEPEGDQGEGGDFPWEDFKRQAPKERYRAENS